MVSANNYKIFKYCMVGKNPGWEVSGWEVSSWESAGWEMSGWETAG